jgi:DNA polymerase III epsilon subunit-like protein
MFRSASSIFDKICCPLKDGCPFGPTECIFSHDSNVYRHPTSLSQTSLPSLHYLNGLLERRAIEERAVASSSLFQEPNAGGPKTADSESTIDGKSALLDSVASGQMDAFISRAPVGCRVSFDLRRRTLVHLMRAHLDAGIAGEKVTIAEMGRMESRFLERSGKSCSPSVYLSQVAEFTRKIKSSSQASAASKGVPEAFDDNALLQGLLASETQRAAHAYPLASDSDSTPLDLTCRRQCRRCGVPFVPSDYYGAAMAAAAITTGSMQFHPPDPPSASTCCYHPGKAEKTLGRRLYSCCQKPVDSSAEGCESGTWHVFEQYGRNERPSFPPIGIHAKESASPSNKQTIVALDAEMFYTAGGYEMGRLTVVDYASEATLLDVLVRPRYPPVLDYNGKWSGLSPELFASGALPVVSFAELVEQLAGIIDGQTIIIGHSLENDLRVLGMSHDRVIDTSIIYPHPFATSTGTSTSTSTGASRNTGGMRLSLRNLALGQLSAFIQQASAGHDSREDCLTCIRLVKKKCAELQKDLGGLGPV